MTDHETTAREIEKHVTEVHTVTEQNVTLYLKYRDSQIQKAAQAKNKTASIFDKLIKPFTPGPRVWVQDLPQMVRTGDVLLFSAHASDLGGNIIKFFTNTQWNHVGIVYKPEPHRTYMIDWTAGLHVYDLVEVLRMDVYETSAWQEVAVRQLEFADGVDRVMMEEKLEEFLHGLIDSVGRSTYKFKDGTQKVADLGEGIGNTAFPIGQGVKAFFKQVSAELHVPSCTTRKTKEDVKDDLTTLFCSKFVAACYKGIGLIAPHRNSADFTPKAFAPEGDAFLDLQNGAALGRPIAISFEPLVARKAVVSLLGAVMRAPVVVVGALSTARTEDEKAARVMQRFIRGIRAIQMARRVAEARRKSVAERRSSAAGGGGGWFFRKKPSVEEVPGETDPYKELTKKISQLKNATFQGEVSDPDKYMDELGLCM